MICYTVGHSKLLAEEFIRLIAAQRITCLADVRSTPYSEFSPQFNQSTLKASLASSKISYEYLGDLLGGRYTNEALLFDDGVVNYSKVACTPQYEKGLASLLTLIQTAGNVAVMCSEKEPGQCHRAIMIGRSLAARHVDVKHILQDGQLLSQSDLEEQLLKKYCNDYQSDDLFAKKTDRAEAVARAYELCNRKIAYTHKQKELQ